MITPCKIMSQLLDFLGAFLRIGEADPRPKIHGSCNQVCSQQMVVDAR